MIAFHSFPLLWCKEFASVLTFCLSHMAFRLSLKPARIQCNTPQYVIEFGDAVYQDARLNRPNTERRSGMDMRPGITGSRNRHLRRPVRVDQRNTAARTLSPTECRPSTSALQGAWQQSCRH